MCVLCSSTQKPDHRQLNASTQCAQIHQKRSHDSVRLKNKITFIEITVRVVYAHTYALKQYQFEQRLKDCKMFCFDYRLYDWLANGRARGGTQRARGVNEMNIPEFLKRINRLSFCCGCTNPCIRSTLLCFQIEFTPGLVVWSFCCFVFCFPFYAKSRSNFILAHDFI